MKKSIIIVVSIGVITLLVFILGSSFLANRKLEATTLAQEARIKSIDAGTKAKILELSLLLEDWYDQNQQSYAGFTNKQQNNDKASDLINALAKKKNISLDYFIDSAEMNYVVRIRSMSLGKTYCFDSTSMNITETILLTEEDFKSKTNCKGELLKN